MPDVSPYLTRPEEEIKEPISRSTPKEARYASESQDVEREKAVIEPSKLYLEKGELPPPSEGKMGGRLKGRDKLPRFGHLQDSVNIYNQRKSDWQMAWEHRFNKRTKFDFFSFKEVKTNTTVYSKPFYCAPYRWALIFENMVRSADGSQIIHKEVEFSWDGVSFFEYWENWFGYDQIVDAMSPHRDCMPIPILAPWIRYKYTTTGTDDTNYFTVSIFGVFNSV